MKRTSLILQTMLVGVLVACAIMAVVTDNALYAAIISSLAVANAFSVFTEYEEK